MIRKYLLLTFIISLALTGCSSFYEDLPIESRTGRDTGTLIYNTFHLVQLNYYTYVKITGKNRDVIKLTGQAYVQMHSLGKKMFKIPFGNFTVQYMDASFDINAYDAEPGGSGIVRLSVAEGDVFIAYTDKIDTIHQGEAVDLTRDAVVRNITWSGKDASNWLDGFYRYDSIGIMEFSALIKRLYNKSVTTEGNFTDDGLKGLVLFPEQALAPQLNNLAADNNLEITYTNNDSNVHLKRKL